MHRKTLFAMLLGVSMLFGCASIAMAAQLATLKIMPPYLQIGTFFSGREVDLSGSIPPDRDIVIEIKGPEEKSAFNMKGRVGPFWMNREKIELEHAPFLYMLLLPEMKKGNLLLSSPGIGVEKLKQTLVIRPDNTSLDSVFDMFVRLKRSEQLYGEMEGAIRYSQARGEKKKFETQFYFPSSSAPGQYKIVARILHDGKIEETRVHSFVVEEVGFIKRVHNLAYNHGLVYGILCVIIALFVGAIIGLFFRHAEDH